jgi:hypothetical protein
MKAATLVEIDISQLCSDPRGWAECPMKNSTLEFGTRLLRCGISDPAMTAVDQKRRWQRRKREARGAALVRY